MALPASIPVIVLAECNVFPHALLPLNIFEPRYQAMLARALQTDRFLCVVTLKHAADDTWNEGDSNLHEFTCAGLLRACVAQPDGTSRLILQGVRRVRITGWEQRDPFRIATVEPIASRLADADHAHNLARHALQLARASMAADTAFAEQFERQFGALNDPEIVADVIGYNFLRTASERQPLLGMTGVEDRLRYVVERLEARAGEA